MKITKLSAKLLAVAALAFVPTIANAVVGDTPNFQILHSAGLFAENGQAQHGCVISNVTTANIQVKIDILDTFGGTLQTTTNFVVLNAGATTEVSNLSVYTGYARCRFTIKNVDTAGVRAYGAVWNPITGPHRGTEALSEAH